MQDARETILVVDDEEANRYVMAHILRRAGFHVVQAAAGEDALALLASERPQLVVLDVNLPDISGIEICRRIKQDAETSSTMVLQVSATHITTTDRVEALSAGADSFLVEPVEPEELVAVTRALLRLYRAEEALKTSLAQKELLLREVNHRIKNNLQIISSLLHMQSSEIEDAAVRQKLADLQSRVISLAAVHEQLYRSSEVAAVDFREFGQRLAEQICSLHEERLTDVQLSLALQPIVVPADTAIHLALIMNELLSNSFKHAFPDGRAGQIDVSFDQLEDGRIRLRVADDGCGLPAPENEDTASLGLRLVKAMAAQLSAELAVETAAGTTTILTCAIGPQVSPDGEQ